jgi:hypothetical protein
MAVVSVSDDELSEEEDEDTSNTPSSTIPVPALSTGASRPKLLAKRPASNSTPPAYAITAQSCPDFNEYRRFLQYRSPPGSEPAVIYHPPAGSIGDGDGWYYVSVGKTVGVFNVWYVLTLAQPGLR